jgi:hypothetical protein
MILTHIGDRALRVCWRADGSAVVLQAVSVRPACGLVKPAAGATVFPAVLHHDLF